jgi:hypothetical protein
MQTITDHDAITFHLHRLTDELSAGCDTDFDTAYEDLDREFQELRLQLSNHG